MIRRVMKRLEKHDRIETALDIEGVHVRDQRLDLARQVPGPFAMYSSNGSCTSTQVTWIPHAGEMPGQGPIAGSDSPESAHLVERSIVLIRLP